MSKDVSARQVLRLKRALDAKRRAGEALEKELDRACGARDEEGTPVAAWLVALRPEPSRLAQYIDQLAGAVNGPPWSPYPGPGIPAPVVDIREWRRAG